MTVAIPISIGELIDKITILEIKAKKLKDPQKLINVRKELELLQHKAPCLLDNSPELKNLKTRLRSINEKLWLVEDTLRGMERRKCFDDQFIEMARSVYFTNDERSKVKREINRLTNSELTEEKSYTDY